MTAPARRTLGRRRAAATERDLVTELAARVGPSHGAARPDLKAGAPRTVNAATVAAREATVAPGVCACGVANDADARFCKSCGTQLRAA